MNQNYFRETKYQTKQCNCNSEYQDKTYQIIKKNILENKDAHTRMKRCERDEEIGRIREGVIMRRARTEDGRQQVKANTKTRMGLIDRLRIL